jgi:hypothetical protein
MTDEVATKLMTIVERPVRPVLATKARKHAMREELLSHVTDVYDDELARRAGESAMRLAIWRMRAGLPFSLLILVLLAASAHVLDASRRNAWGFVVTLAIVEGVFLGCGSFVLVWCSQDIREALFGDPRYRNWRKAAPYLLLSALSLPAAAFTVYALLVHDLKGALHHAALACWLAPLAPLLFALIGRSMIQEQQFEARGSTLSIDE